MNEDKGDFILFFRINVKFKELFRKKVVAGAGFEPATFGL